MEKSPMALLAAEYDNKIKTLIPFYNEILNGVEGVAKSVIVNKDIIWLDLGCGTGKLAEKVIEDFDVKQMILLDNSQEMLTIAQNRLKETKTKITYRKEDLNQLCFHTRFDVISSVQVLHYIKQEERKNVIANCYEALKPSHGVYINVENVAPFTEKGTACGLERWGHYQYGMGRTQKEVQEHIARYGKDYYPINIAEHIQLLKEIGFKYVEMFWLTYMQAGFFAIK